MIQLLCEHYSHIVLHAKMSIVHPIFSWKTLNSIAGSGKPCQGSRSDVSVFINIKEHMNRKIPTPCLSERNLMSQIHTFYMSSVYWRLTDPHLLYTWIPVTYVSQIHTFYINLVNGVSQIHTLYMRSANRRLTIPHFLYKFH
jgi:hypothetical protein